MRTETYQIYEIRPICSRNNLLNLKDFGIREGLSKEENEQLLFKRLYSEIKFKVAVSDVHLEQVKSKSKKQRSLSYMNYTDCVFSLDILLD